MKLTLMAGLIAAGTALGLVALPAQAQQGGAAADVRAKRAELRKMCDDALATLYKAKPELKARVAKAAGYGCFTSFGMSFFVGGAGGEGLVHSNLTKRDVYMKMGQASGGFDFGVKQYREVLVFNDAKTLDQFVNKGWEISGDAGAVAVAEGKGAKAQESGTNSPIEIYPMTTSGLAVGFAAVARKYWKDDELNAAK
jgi:lipid-binding SYLF domain-containing protein